MNVARSWPLAAVLVLVASGPGCGEDKVEPRTPVPREDTGLEPEPLPAREAIEDCPTALEGTIDVDRTITAGCDVSVPGHVSVDGATLTLQPGVTLRFADGAGMVVSSFRPAKLVVEGNEEAPVTMVAAGNADARWGGLTLGGGANGSSLRDLRLRQGPEGRPWLTVRAQEVERERVVDRAPEGDSAPADPTGETAAEPPTSDEAPSVPAPG